MPGPYDFAIIGSTSLSLLLAGVLARDHGRKVLRIGRKPSAQRLPRSIDLALMQATRPETWRMLRDADAESRRLLATIGAKLDDVVVQVVADIDTTRTALDHIGHVAAGYQQFARPISCGWRFGGVSFLSHAANTIPAWLDGLGVDFADADTVRLTYGKTGVAQLDGIECGAIVLSDDAALVDLDESVRPPTLVMDAVTMTLLQSAPKRRQPLQFFADRQVTVVPRDASTMLARIRHHDDAEARLASALGGPFPIRRLATAHYRSISPRDGAPVIGRLTPSLLFVVAGLEEAAAFFAPALARLLVGNPSPDEHAWFAAHDPARPRAPVAEFVP